MNNLSQLILPRCPIGIHSIYVILFKGCIVAIICVGARSIKLFSKGISSTYIYLVIKVVFVEIELQKLDSFRFDSRMV